MGTEIRVVVSGGRGGTGVHSKRARGSGWGWWPCWDWFVVMAAPLSRFTKHHRNVSLKWVTFTIHKTYLHSDVLKKTCWRNFGISRRLAQSSREPANALACILPLPSHPPRPGLAAPTLSLSTGVKHLGHCFIPVFVFIVAVVGFVIVLDEKWQTPGQNQKTLKSKIQLLVNF